MAAITFHEVRDPNAKPLACDACGCLVPSEERARAAHSDWHQEREELVVDLTLVRERLSA